MKYKISNLLNGPNLIIISAMVIFAWFTIDAFNQTIWFGKHIDFDLGTQYGTLIGGIFSFLSVVLIYLTLRHQNDSFESSAFESRFFQLLNYHRKNVDDWEYKNPQTSEGDLIKGARVFIYIHREISEAIKHLRSSPLQINNINQILSNDAIIKLTENKTINTRSIDQFQLELINLAYLIVFFGLSKESRPVLEKILTQRCEKEKIKLILDYFQSIPANWDKSKPANWENSKNANWDKLNNEYFKYSQRITKNYHFKYFGGHQHRLGHYFRHLFQTVKYCNKAEFLRNKYITKYEYIKTLRAQMSTYEQAVFTYNSLSVLGRIWEIDKVKPNKQLITKYNLIKNIPAEFISEINLEMFYPDVEYEGRIPSVNRKKLKKQFT